jgi:hypothetical protein
MSLNLFMKKLTRERVVPTISARGSWEITRLGCERTFGAHAHAGRLLVEVEDECGGTCQSIKAICFKPSGTAALVFAG